MSKSKQITITVQGTTIGILPRPEGDYISLTDMVRNFDGSGALIDSGSKTKTPFYSSESGSASITQILIPPNSREVEMRSVETASSFRPTNVDVADAATQAGRDSTAMSRAGKHTPLATSYSLPATAASPPSKIQNRAKPQRLLPQLCNLQT